jgi:hypothetical protein
VKLTIPIPEKVSLNRIYAGVHFRERSRHKDDYRLTVLCVPEVRPYEGEYPVHIHYHFRLAGSKLDISNHAYMIKMLEDALVACGVIPDDDQQYVGMISVTSERVAKGEYDEVDVELIPFPTSYRSR